MSSQQVLSYGRTVPPGKLWEGLYIDDHLFLEVVGTSYSSVRQSFRNTVFDTGVVGHPYGPFRVPRLCPSDPDACNLLPSHCQPSSASRNSCRLLDSCYSAYRQHGLELSASKCFRRKRKFAARGTAVDDCSGVVGSPLVKRVTVAQIALKLARASVVSKKAMQKMLGLFVHPFQHRRLLMSVWDTAYVWTAQLSDTGLHPLPLRVSDEIVCAALLLPLASANIRWPVNCCVSTTDATPVAAGATATVVDEGVAVPSTA